MSAKSGGVFIMLFTTVTWAPVGIASAKCTLIFSTGLIKKTIGCNKKQKEKAW